MKKAKVKELLGHAVKSGMSELDNLKAQLDMAMGLIIAQRMKIANLECAKKETILPHKDI